MASPDTVLTNQRALHLSSQGDRLFLRINNSMSLYERGSLGWVSIESPGESTLATENSEQAPSSNELSHNPKGAMRLLAVSTSASLHRLLTLYESEQQVWLIQWQESIGHDLLTHWLPGTPILVSGLIASHDISLMSNDQGDKVAIAGWEDSGLELHTPVVWRFNINETDIAATGSDNLSTHSLSVLDSLRLSPSRQTNANLQFSSDSSLTNLAIGWQSEENADAGTLKDATLVTYSYHAATRQWLTALELPGNITTLAKQQTFAGKVVISADGSTLLLGSSGFSQGLNPDSDGVLVLH